MKLSAKLRAKLQKLEDSPVKFSKKKACFLHNKKKKPGLTKMLKRMFPVPQTFDGKRERLSLHSKRVAHFAGPLVARCGTCVDAVEAAKLGERNHDKAHGILVDAQLTLYVQKGREALFRQCSVVDPCVGTLIEQLDAEGLALIAAQVSIYCEQIDAATAIDLIASDRDKLRKFVLIEVKAAREIADNDYESARGILGRGAMKDLPLSYYGLHQTQLLCMQQMLERDYDIVVDEARVMRVCPGTVHTYKLNDKWHERRTALFAAIRANMLSRKRRRKSKK